MDKEQKSALVDEIADRLGGANAIFAVDYRGISVPQAAELRAQLSEADATFRVVKNRLAKRAVERAGTGELDQVLEGPTALTFVKGDAVTAAKAIATFGRQHDILEYKGGLMDGAPLDPGQFQVIARLPGLDVLRGQLVGIAASPISGLARGLASMVSGLAVALGQIQEKGLVGGGVAEEEPAAEEEPREEEPAAEEEPAGADDGAAAESAEESTEEASEESPATTEPADGEPDEESAEADDDEAEQEAQPAAASEAEPAVSASPGEDVQEETKSEE
ncbi:MAG: 50S ribosomal protein L10 [Solirubrobacterales bacterium]